MSDTARTGRPTRRGLARLTAGLALAVGMAACSPGAPAPTGSPSAGVTIRIGTLMTDDILPLWAAVDDGSAAAAGLTLSIQTFTSAQEQTAAVTAGQLDAIMTDMVVPVQLSASGTPMRSVTRLQGAPAGIVAGKDSGLTSLKDLAGVETGCSSPTIMEYIYDRAMTDAGVPAAAIKTSEIKNLSVRLQMLSSGGIKAAVLPWTLHSLAVAQGGTSLLGVDEAGPYSQTVLAFRDAWLKARSDLGPLMAALLSVWDAEVAKINASPDSYRGLLAAQAKLPAPLDQTYAVRQYPIHALPDKAQFEAVVTWMVSKGYIAAPLAYDTLVWVPGSG